MSFSLRYLSCRAPTPTLFSRKIFSCSKIGRSLYFIESQDTVTVLYRKISKTFFNFKPQGPWFSGSLLPESPLGTGRTYYRRPFFSLYPGDPSFFTEDKGSTEYSYSDVTGGSLLWQAVRVCEPSELRYRPSHSPTVYSISHFEEIVSFGQQGQSGYGP